MEKRLKSKLRLDPPLVPNGDVPMAENLSDIFVSTQLKIEVE